MINDSMDFYDMYRSRMTGCGKMKPLSRRKTPPLPVITYSSIKMLIGRCLRTCGGMLVTAGERLAAQGIIEKRRPSHV